MSFFSGDTSDDDPDDDDDSRPAKYRALAEQGDPDADAVAFADRCATNGCFAEPTAAVYLTDHIPHPYCTSCAGDRLARDPGAREYPLSALTDPLSTATEAVGPVTLDRVKEDGDGVLFELSCTRTEASGEAFLAATNSHDGYGHGSISVLDLEASR